MASKGKLGKTEEKTGSGRYSNKKKISPGKQVVPKQVLPSPAKLPAEYTKRTLQPAKNYDVISMARAMNQNFGAQVKEIFEPEVIASKLAIETGIYVGWRCPDFKHDCQRVGPHSKCFCGHLLSEHKQYNGLFRREKSCTAKSINVPCVQKSCKCKSFCFIPSRPEEVGEFWLRRRPNYEEIAKAWRAKCKCKHTHEEHDPCFKSCKARGCSCSGFTSSFLCAACDRRWELHETIFESEQERVQNGFPVGEDYLPFGEIPSLKNMAITGEDDGFYFKGNDPMGMALGPSAAKPMLPAPFK